MNNPEYTHEQVLKAIRSLPYWVRFKDYCPYKLYGIRVPSEIFDLKGASAQSVYYKFLQNFFDADENLAQCIMTAARCAAEEDYERKAFKKQVSNAPIEVQYQFGIEKTKTAYQNPASRNEFRRLLAVYYKKNGTNALPEGFNDHSDKYFKNRQVVRQPINHRSSHSAHQTEPQIRPNSYVPNYR